MANLVASVRAQADPATSLRTVSLFSFFQGVTGDSYGDPHCIYHAPSGEGGGKERRWKGREEKSGKEKKRKKLTFSLKLFLKLFLSPRNRPTTKTGRFFAVAYQQTGTLATFVPLAMSAVNDPVRDEMDGRERARARERERERERRRKKE